MTLLDALDQSREDFVWKDGERLIAFGGSALASLPGFLHAAKMEEYALLSSEHGLAQFSGQVGADEVIAGAAVRINVPAGMVASLSRDLREEVGDRAIVAIGGGRVIDTAKAIAGTWDQRVAAIPTTLSGAPMTGTHRLPSGYSGEAKNIRPAIAIGIPDLMASQDESLRTGSAMNALSHAIESLFVETGSAVPRLAGSRAVKLLFRSLHDDTIDEATRRRNLSLGAIEAGYALGSTGYAIHHVLCQTIVAIGEVPHAPTYGVMLPFTLEFLKNRDELTWQLVSEEMGTQDPSVMIAKTCAAAGNPTTLTDLGVAPERIDQIVAAASERPQLRLTPGGANANDVRSIIESAL